MCFDRDKQGIKGLPPLFPAPQIPAEAPPVRYGTNLRSTQLTKPNSSRHNQQASVASLRRLFAFTGTPFGFPLESPFTFAGIPNEIRGPVKPQVDASPTRGCLKNRS